MYGMIYDYYTGLLAKVKVNKKMIMTIGIIILTMAVFLKVKVYNDNYYWSKNLVEAILNEFLRHLLYLYCYIL